MNRSPFAAVSSGRQLVSWKTSECANVVVRGGSESEGVVWAGGVVCVMVLQRVDERRAAERATVPSSPSGLLARSLLALTSQQQQAASRSAWLAAPHRLSAKLLRYAKSPGKTPAEPW